MMLPMGDGIEVDAEPAGHGGPGGQAEPTGNGVSPGHEESAARSEGAAGAPAVPGFLRSLWFHAALLAILLAAVAPLASNGHLVMPDEGVYLAQARQLSEGSWAEDRQSLDIDPDGDLVPYTDGGTVGEQVVRYHKHPLFPVLLTPAFKLAGMEGALAVSMIGTWCAALVAAFIARGIRPRYGVWALWFVGLASPLFFDAYIVVAHAPAAALAGLSFLGVSRALRSGTARHLAYGLPAMAGLVLLRSEGLLFAVALAGSVGVMALGWPPLESVRWRRIGVAVSIGMVAVVSFLTEKWWATQIVGTRVSNSPAAQLSREAINPLSGAWASLLRPFYGGWEFATLMMPLLVLGVWLAGISLRVLPRRPLLPLVALTGATVAAVGLWVDPPWLVTGLLAVCPFIVPGLVWLGRKELRNTTIALGLVTMAITSVGIIVVNYRVGGSTEWGGRFFHILLPILIPVVLVGLDNARRALSPGQARFAVGCFVVISLCTAGAAVDAQRDLRASIADMVGGTVAAVEAAREAGYDDVLVVPVMRSGDGSDRYFWDQDIEVLTTIPIANFDKLLQLADQVGRERLIMVSNIDPLQIQLLIGDEVQRSGWKVVDASNTPGGAAVLIIMEKDQTKPKDQAKP